MPLPAGPAVADGPDIADGPDVAEGPAVSLCWDAVSAGGADSGEIWSGRGMSRGTCEGAHGEGHMGRGTREGAHSGEIRR